LQNISVYIQPEFEKFFEKLKKKAENQDRSLSYLINEAVRDKVKKEDE